MRYFDRFFEIRNNHPGIDDIFAARMSGRYQWPIRVLGRFKTGRECRGFSEGRQISVTFNIDVFRSIPFCRRGTCSSRRFRRNIRRITGEEKKKRQRGRERGRENESKREREGTREKKKKKRNEFSRTESNRLQSFTIVVMIITLKDYWAWCYSRPWYATNTPSFHTRNIELRDVSLCKGRTAPDNAPRGHGKNSANDIISILLHDRGKSRSPVIRMKRRWIILFLSLSLSFLFPFSSEIDNSIPFDRDQKNSKWKVGKKVGEIRESVFQLSLDKKRADIIKSANFTRRFNSSFVKGQNDEIRNRHARPMKMRILSRRRRRIFYFLPRILSLLLWKMLVDRKVKGERFVWIGGHGGINESKFLIRWLVSWKTTEGIPSGVKLFVGQKEFQERETEVGARTVTSTPQWTKNLSKRDEFRVFAIPSPQKFPSSPRARASYRPTYRISIFPLSGGDHDR